MTTPVTALLGRTGALTGQQVLTALRTLVPEGTVALAQVDDDGVPVLRGVALLALAGGEVKARHLLGRFAGLAVADLHVHAVAHPPSGVPTLPALAPDAPLDALRVLPRMVAARALPAAATDVARLLQQLEAARWDGALLARSGDDAAFATLVAGRVAAAGAHHVGTGDAQGSDALRALARVAGSADATLELAPLDATTAAAAAGYATKRTRAAHAGAASGLVVAADGATLHVRGEPVLRVAGAPARHGAFALLEDASAPLRLPVAPTHAEARAFALTLRGRDALNPMTDRWMRFRTTYGPRGQRVLEAFGDGATVEELAIAHGVEVEELAGWVRTWAEEGLVREG